MNPIKTKFVLTQEAFDLLLRWLDPDDRDRAGQRYEEIRQSIIRNFARRGSPVAEELADEVMNRVAKRLPEIIDSYDGDQGLYFYAVAARVQKEHLRKRPKPVPVPIEPQPENVELIFACLEKCLNKDPETCKLIIEYFRDEKGAKIETRKLLSRRLGIPLNTLRTRAYRIKLKLRACMEDCLKRN